MTSKNNSIVVAVALNEVNPAAYGGWYGRLRQCHNDIDRWIMFLKKAGVEDFIILKDQQATIANFETAVLRAAQQLRAGDLFTLVFSGHGGQHLANNFDVEYLDETWCLYDGEYLDNLLLQLLGKFRPKVRVVIVSDSCHSGGMDKSQPEMPSVSKGKPNEFTSMRLYADAYRNNHAADNIHASVKLLSACTKNQLSYETPRGGAFTDAAMATLQRNNIITYAGFMAQITKLLSNQTPTLIEYGTRLKYFDKEPVFFV